MPPVADLCALGALAALLVTAFRHPSGRVELLVGVLAVALVTTALSLDATVVLLTPVVVATSLALGTPHRPGATACLRMANSASILLPVSNLTNLLALPHLDLGFTGFALAMAPVLAVVLLVEYAGLWLLHRRDLSLPPARSLTTAPLRVPVVPVTAVGLMLVGFAAASALGIDPAWVSGATAAVLAAWALRRGLTSAGRTIRAAHPSFAVFVLALGLVVAALGEGVLGDDLARLVPAGAGLADLLWIAVVAALLSALVTNLSATLLLVPMLAGLGDVAVLAALLGLTIGSGLTWTGSLATLLWRRTLQRQGLDAPSRELHRVSLTLTPLCLTAAVVTLWLTT